MLNTVNTTELEAKLKTLTVEKLGTDVYKVINPDNSAIVLEVLAVDVALKTISIRHNHAKHDLVFKNSLDLVLDKMGIKRTVENVSTDVKAPMPGKVISVIVNEGDTIAKGEGIVILEAMKMENVLKATNDCTIKKILISEGINVEKNQVLIELG